MDPEQLAALVAQLQAATPPGLTQTAAAAPATPPAKPAAETPAKPAEAAKPADGQPDVYKWLGDLEKKILARETGDKAAAEAREREALTEAIAKSAPAADVGKIKELLGKLEGFYTGKLTAKDQTLAQVQEQLHKTARGSALAEAVAGVDWVNPFAAKDALSKLEGRVEVVTDGHGNTVVREKGTGRAVGELVKEAVASEEFAHLLKAGSRGKGGIGNGNSASPTQTNPNAPVDLIEGVLARIEHQKQQQQSAGLFQTPGLGRPAKR